MREIHKQHFNEIRCYLLHPVGESAYHVHQLLVNTRIQKKRNKLLESFFK